MARALDDDHAQARSGGAQPRDWRRSMSDNVAIALIVYTGLQIFFTVDALKQGFSSILPYISLVVLIAAIIPACRWFEKRWLDISDEAAADPALRGHFRRDQALLWLLAIGLPAGLTIAFTALFG